MIAMPLLARAKKKAAARLGSRAMHADSRQTDIRGRLPAILPIGDLGMTTQSREVSTASRP